MEKSVSCILSSLGNGGAERVLVNLANEFNNDGYNVIMYTIRDNEQYYRVNDGIKIVNLNVNISNRYIRAIARFLKLRKLIKHDKSSTIIVFERFYGISAALFTGKKIICSERNDPYSNLQPKSFLKKYRDWLYKKSDVVVFQTEFAKNYFNERIKEHGVVIPNPIVNELPNAFTGDREKKIVAVCRLEPQKNLHMMIDCFNDVYLKYPEYKLVIYGEGNLREELQKHINTLECHINIEMPGFVTNVYDKIIKASMYISTSDYEGISNSMLEALALGIPTICTDCPAGGASLAIQNGVNGLLVPVGDQKAFTNAMSYLIDNPNKSKELSKNAVKVRERFDSHKIYKMWENIM